MCFVLAELYRLVIKAVCKLAYEQILVSICQRSIASKALKGFYGFLFIFNGTLLVKHYTLHFPSPPFPSGQWLGIGFPTPSCIVCPMFWQTSLLRLFGREYLSIWWDSVVLSEYLCTSGNNNRPSVISPLVCLSV